MQYPPIARYPLESSFICDTFTSLARDLRQGLLEEHPLIQNDYRQEKIIFELFSGALQENPVKAPGAITGGALTGQGPTQETIFGELFSGALQENPVIAPGQLHEKMFTELFW